MIAGTGFLAGMAVDFCKTGVACGGAVAAGVETVWPALSVSVLEACSAIGADGADVTVCTFTGSAVVWSGFGSMPGIVLVTDNIAYRFVAPVLRLLTRLGPPEDARPV